MVEGGRIVELSDSASLNALDGVKRLEANGAALFPGFTDTHCHPFEFGWLKRNVDLRGTGNITGLRLRLFARVQKSRPGEWVTGMGWDQEAFSEGRMPDRSDIDDLSGKNPVALTRVCGHIALLNTVAIKALALEDRQGPEFVRDDGARLTGIVKEGALEEVYGKIPRGAEVCANDLLSAEAEAAGCGVTTLHSVLSPTGYHEELEAFAALHAADALSLRYRVYIPVEAMGYVEEKGLRSKLNDDTVRINGVKAYADGSLGARTAALRQPYADDPGNSGILRHTDEELGSIVEVADAAGYQVIIHAIGDRAVEQAIQALSRVTGARNPRRHRIEHASLLPRDLMSDMVKHGIRAAVQPLFITSDTWVAKRLGEDRVNDLYPLKSMLARGTVVSGGSDSPIEQMSPLVGVWAAMVRGGFAPRESLSLDEAFGLYTSNASSNGFDEVGSGLAEGADANLTLLDSDVEGMHPAMVRKVRIAATLANGKLAYSSTGVDG
ncbi:MAG: amidohydrolase [Nitrososphaerales archaeon]|jgi:predicted amidohydrolase YtcJ